MVSEWGQEGIPRGRLVSTTDQVFELPPGLFDDAVLSPQDDAHSGQVFDFGGAYDERVNVEASSGQDARDARKDTGFVLDEAVESMASERLQ